MKNSGKIKSEIKAACEDINVKHYVLPKLNGTRFIGHRITSFTALINIWPALITALSNVVADKKYYCCISIKGDKLKLFPILCKVASYLDLLETIVPASKVFEGEGVMIYDCAIAVTINAE